MATTANITTSYAGSAASKYVAAAVLSAPTIAQNAVTIMPNVKFKHVLRRAGWNDDVLKDGTCDFSAQNTLTIDERYLQLKDLQVNLQLCKSDFRDTWDAIEMGYSANDVLPKTIVDFIFEDVAKRVAAANEVSFWRGATGTTGQYDGIVTRISTDANLPAAQEVAGTSVTAANVVTELRKIVDAIPNRLYMADGQHIYVSQNIYRAYIQSLGGFGASGLGANGYDNKGSMWYNAGAPLFFDGIPLFMANGLASNTAICTTKDNLFFGVGLMSDMNEMRMIDMADIDGSQNVRFVLRYAADANYAFAQDIVTYGITNAAN